MRGSGLSSLGAGSSCIFETSVGSILGAGIELMAIFGWLTMKEAERYTQAARRRRLARNAGRLLVRRVNETSLQKRDGISPRRRKC